MTSEAKNYLLTIIDSAGVVVYDGDPTATLVKIIGLLPSNTFAYRRSFECRCFGSDLWTVGNTMLGSPVNIDIIHESIKINIDGTKSILIIDTLGDFFNHP